MLKGKQSYWQCILLLYLIGPPTCWVFAGFYVTSINLPTFSDTKAWDPCAYIWKCPKILRKFMKIIQTFLRILRSSSELGPRISCAKHNLFSFENWRIFREELSFTRTFQSVFASSTNYTFTYYIFSRRLSDMAATTHTFQLGVRNWSVGVI